MGFPTRISRTSLGETKVDGVAALKPREVVTGKEWNILAWQIAGAGVVVPLAWAFVRGSDGARLGSAETWNPDGDSLKRPAFARSSTGIYTLTFAAAYPDDTGTSVPLVLLCADVSVKSTSSGLIGNWSITGQVVTVRVKSDGGTLTDADFLVKVH